MENEEKTTVQPNAPETQEAPLFCNVCAPGFEGYLQCYRKLIFHRLPAWAAWSLAALAGAAFCQAVWRRDQLVATAALFVLGLYLYRILFAPRRAAQRAVQRAEETYGQSATAEIAFYPDRLCIHNRTSGAQGRFLYDQIEYCAESKDMLMLLTRQKQFVPLSKAGFSGTDAEGFKAFMREKAPGAKFRW